MGVDSFPSNARVQNAFQASAPSNPRVGDIWVDSDDTIVPYDQTMTTGHRNVLINGDMRVTQRGTSGNSATSTTTGWTADRWQLYRGSFVGNCTWSRQTTSGFSNAPYFLRVTRTAGDTSTNVIGFVQSLETINSRPLAGQEVTLSFFMRSGAGYSGSIGAMIQSSTGTDQNYLAGVTGAVMVAQSYPSLTTSEQFFSLTGTVPTDATQVHVIFTWSPTGTAASNSYVDVSGLQLERGPMATLFEHRPYGMELALCQRYYYRVYAGTNAPYGTGQVANTTSGYAYVPFPVTMRSGSPAIETTGTASDYRVFLANTTVQALTSVPTQGNATQQGSQVNWVSTTAGFVAGSATGLLGGSASSYLGWSAEF